MTIDLDAIRTKRQRRTVKLLGKEFLIRPPTLGLLEEIDGEDENNVLKLRKLVEGIFGEGAWSEFRDCDVGELKTICKALVPGLLDEYDPAEDGLAELFEALAGKKKEAEPSPDGGPHALA